MLLRLFLSSVCFITVLGRNSDYNEELRCYNNRFCGGEYTGELQTTISGKRCRRWTNDDLNPTTSRTADDVWRMKNYCRLENFKPLPWCYVESRNREDWEYCFYYFCENFPKPQLESNLCHRPGYFEFEGVCYTVLKEHVESWEEGRQACADESAELISLHSMEEMIFVDSLVCLPKLVSARWSDGRWKWLNDNETALDSDLSKRGFWCEGPYYETLTGNCAALLGAFCFVKLECDYPQEIIHPACSYTPEPVEIAESVIDITWEKAIEHCNASNRQLCGFADLCNQFTYQWTALPLAGDNWIPIVDEYNDWVYAGDGDTDSVCKRHNARFGPPPWGINATICHRTESCRSKVGKVVCCEKSSDTVRTSPVQVPVYVRSRVEDGVDYYRFSKNENLTRADIDEAQWRKYGRRGGDLQMFTLMSGYVKGVAEDPVYFCTKKSSSLSTNLHLVSMKPCSDSWKLNFYLYANKQPLQPENFPNHVYITTTNRNGKMHSRIFQASEKPVTLHFTLYFPSDQDFLLAPERQDPCGTHFERLKDGFGVISTPKFPEPYPKRTSPIACQWKVGADKGHLLKIEFTRMRLKAKKKNQHFTIVRDYERFRTNHGERLFNHQQSCKAEFVNITDPLSRLRNGENWVHYGKFCGDWKPDPFFTTHNAAVIRFQGASSGTSVGFSLIYESIAPPRGLVMIQIPSEERVEFTWENALVRCRSLEKKLCRVEDICGIGRPFYGVEMGNQWTPISEEFNDWLQIGKARGQTCERHNAPYGPPQWGVTESGCDDAEDCSSPCSQKSILYCCNLLASDESQLGSPGQLPTAERVLVTVYTTTQNGRTFYRYLRDGIDTINDSTIWTYTRKHVGDLVNIWFYSHYKLGFDKVVYFCSKPLVLAIGQMQTVYAMFSKPCQTYGDWTLLYYLYAADADISEEETKRIYVGISTVQPYHTRARFGRFPPMFHGLDSFTIYAPSPDFVPDDNDQSRSLDEDVFDTCSSTEQIVIAPAILTSPGYPKRYNSSMDCKWRIKLSEIDADLGVKLRITIVELELEDRADYLLIYDAPLDTTLDELSYKNAREYYGSVRGTTQSTNDTFILHFKSDSSIERKGFKIVAEVVNDKCGGIVEKHGATLTSPNYPKKYKPGLNCTWVIATRNVGFGVEIQFGKFEVRKSANCTKDFVTLGPESNPTMHRFCGVKDFPPRVQFNESIILINFVTGKGKSKGHKGFIFNAFFWPVGTLGGVGNLGAQCGVQDIQPWSGGGDSARDRIVGGMEAIPGSWPWVVHLPEATCGGALLNNKWVVTAGHCFAGREKNRDGTWPLKKDISNYTAVAGRHHRIGKSTGEQVFQVEQVIIHPKYMRSRAGNAGRSVTRGLPIFDIALVKLKQTAVFVNEAVAPICLPTQDVAIGETCVIAGWGTKEILASISGNAKDSLHYAHVHTLANSLCNTYDALRGSVTDKMICAGYPGGGVDSCSGDSGGPLMCKGPGRNYQIKGVVSWGRGCGKRNQPGIYTRVWSYYDWISSIIYT